MLNNILDVHYFITICYSACSEKQSICSVKHRRRWAQYAKAIVITYQLLVLSQLLLWSKLSSIYRYLLMHLEL